MSFFNYIRYSNIKFSLDLNPFCWGFSYTYCGPTNIDPKLHIWHWRILFLTFHVVWDDGSYILEEMEYIGDIKEQGDEYE